MPRRKMSVPRPRVTVAKGDLDDGVDAERGATDDDGDGKHELKFSSSWRRSIIALLCFVSVAGGASRILIREDTEVAAVADGELDLDQSGRSDPLRIGYVIMPLIEVSVLAERRFDSAEVGVLEEEQPATVRQVAPRGNPKQRWVQVQTAAGEVGWVNYLSESGVRIFEVKAKAELEKSAKKSPRKKKRRFGSAPAKPRDEKPERQSRGEWGSKHKIPKKPKIPKKFTKPKNPVFGFGSPKAGRGRRGKAKPFGKR